MTWWRRRKAEDDQAAEHARDARRQAEAGLAAERSRLTEAEEIAARLREWRRRNHFAEMITESVRRAQ